MKEQKKWFSIVEVILVITIVSILTSISFISSRMIWESNIRNVWMNVSTFISDIKGLIMKNPWSEIFVYFSSQQQDNLNKYIFSYHKKNTCNHIQSIDDLFLVGYRIDDDNNAFFTWSIINSWSVLINKEVSLNSLLRIDSTVLNKKHNISDGEKYIYNLYWTWQILNNQWIPYDGQLNCWDIYVYFLNSSWKNKYEISQLWYEVNSLIAIQKSLLLKYSSWKIEWELYLNNNSNSQKRIYDIITISISDSISNLSSEIDI